MSAKVGILSDLKILDLGSALAAPYAAMLMADMGAQVIKVEKPRRGDMIRATDSYVQGESGYFLGINRGKDSVTVDIRKPEGRDIIRQMIPETDILVENFRSPRMDEWGLSYAELSAINPRLIYCSVSAFGDMPGFEETGGNDIIAQAYSGLMDITGNPDREPSRTGSPVVDVSCGMLATIGILSAVHERAKTGRGRHVKVSLLESAYALMPNYVVSVLNGEPNFTRQGSGHPQIAPYQAYPAGDGRYVVVGAFHNTSWKAFCDTIGRSDLTEDARFLKNADRVAHRQELSAILEVELKKRTSREWVSLFEKNDILAAPILNLKDSFAHFAALNADLIASASHGTLGKLRMLRNPISFDGATPTASRAAPVLGADTERRLTELGYTKQQIADLHARKLV
jgi:crotonobetainyl-CoA:carnitine CoA-transferase CaiB-like acyl-CoA transferase